MFSGSAYNKYQEWYKILITRNGVEYIPYPQCVMPETNKTNITLAELGKVAESILSSRPSASYINSAIDKIDKKLHDEYKTPYEKDCFLYNLILEVEKHVDSMIQNDYLFRPYMFQYGISKSQDQRSKNEKHLLLTKTAPRAISIPPPAGVSKAPIAVNINPAKFVPPKAISTAAPVVVAAPIAEESEENLLLIHEKHPTPSENRLGVSPQREKLVMFGSYAYDKYQYSYKYRITRNGVEYSDRLGQPNITLIELSKVAESILSGNPSATLINNVIDKIDKNLHDEYEAQDVKNHFLYNLILKIEKHIDAKIEIDPNLRIYFNLREEAKNQSLRLKSYQMLLTQAPKAISNVPQAIAAAPKAIEEKPAKVTITRQQELMQEAINLSLIPEKSTEPDSLSPLQQLSLLAAKKGGILRVHEKGYAPSDDRLTVTLEQQRNLGVKWRRQIS